MHKLFFLTLFSVSIYVQLFAQKGRIVKSTSFYYVNESVKITDSMFVTLNHYNAKGNLIKKEETHYLYGKKSKTASITYRNENQIIEMYNNNKLVLKVNYDSAGTETKQWGLINYGKDTLEISFYPMYVNGKLLERKSIVKLKNGNDESVEYYEYQSYPDSSTVTATTKKEYLTTIQKKCYDKSKRLLYTQHIIKSSGSTTKLGMTIKYDSKGNKTDIISTNGKTIESRQKLYYKNNVLVFSINQTPTLLIKTVYE